MAEKNDILGGLKQVQYDADPLPDLDDFGVTYDDILAQFDASLQAVGGTLLRAASLEAAAAAVAELDVARDAKQVFWAVPDVMKSTVDLATMEDPRELNHLPLAVVPGEFAVAENGAVWIDPSSLAHRVVLFIAEHLVVVVQKSELVHNMHQAYERLGTEMPNYGLFVSGPSKTADIEQSLVIGAQGARSLYVCLIGE